MKQLIKDKGVVGTDLRNGDGWAWVVRETSVDILCIHTLPLQTFFMSLIAEKGNTVKKLISVEKGKTVNLEGNIKRKKYNILCFLRMCCFCVRIFNCLMQHKFYYFVSLIWLLKKGVFCTPQIHLFQQT